MERWRRAFAQVGTIALYFLAAALLADVALVSFREKSLAVDAVHSYLPAARDLVHDRSPYHLAHVPLHTAFGSPPFAALLFTPFLLLSAVAGEVALSILSLLAVLAALRVVGVRDWRCYAVLSLSLPLASEFQTANLSALLALCAATAWRYRHRAVGAGVSVGAMVALKLIAWPLILFLIFTRRFKASLYSIAFAAGAIAVPWAAVGFAGLRTYPHLLSALARNQRQDGGSIATVAMHVMPSADATAVSGIACGILLAAAWRLRADHRRSFALCIAASLACSPLVWAHYVTLLLVPFAIAVPTFGPLWLLPLALWFTGSDHNRLEGQLSLLLLQAALLAIALRRSPSSAALGDDELQRVDSNRADASLTPGRH